MKWLEKEVEINRQPQGSGINPKSLRTRYIGLYADVTVWMCKFKVNYNEA
jgi:hypothetical protein